MYIYVYIYVSGLKPTTGKFLDFNIYLEKCMHEIVIYIYIYIHIRTIHIYIYIRVHSYLATLSALIQKHKLETLSCSVLQCVAVCCSVLQCVAVCCSVLQCAAVCCIHHTKPDSSIPHPPLLTQKWQIKPEAVSNRAHTCPAPTCLNHNFWNRIPKPSTLNPQLNTREGPLSGVFYIEHVRVLQHLWGAYD